MKLKRISDSGITVLLGRNGAGKTTTLRSIMGLNPASKGEIRYKGERLDQLPTHLIARKGVGYVPEDQGIFADLTVGETMRIAMRGNSEEAAARLEWTMELFPDLRRFWNRKSGLLSGGQKQIWRSPGHMGTTMDCSSSMNLAKDLPRLWWRS